MGIRTDAALAKRFNFTAAKKLPKQKQDEFEAELPPRAKVLFQAARLGKTKRTRKAKKK